MTLSPIRRTLVTFGLTLHDVMQHMTSIDVSNNLRLVVCHTAEHAVLHCHLPIAVAVVQQYCQTHRLLVDRF